TDPDQIKCINKCVHGTNRTIVAHKVFKMIGK
ncbi:MAG: hypothetical protein ACI8Q6_001606, partial [Granulosicoccus sp.]